MGNRVIVGKKGSEYGLWVSKPGSDVTSVGDKDMLFASSASGMGQVLFFQSIDVSNGVGVTTEVSYLNQGNGKTFMNWWTATVGVTWMSGDATDYYTDSKQISGSYLIDVESTVVNSTTNKIIVTNKINLAQTIIVLVMKEAAG